MRRIAALACLALLGSLPSAEAADRTDRIPASVGPADFRGYHVNSTAFLPEGLTEARWNAVARRVLERWGGTYLGTTTASPDHEGDGLNVIGFSPTVQGATLGVNAKSKEGLVRSLGGDDCEWVSSHHPSDSLVTAPKRFRLRLRADVVRGGRVRKRTRRVTRSLERQTVVVKMLDARRCVSYDGAESDPASIRHESDVRLQIGANWYFGTEHPDSGQVDLETVLLHELGHSVGLDHQPQDCDPSTPMRPITNPGEYWRGLDEVFYAEPCTAPYQPAPDPPTGAEGPYPGGSLGGRAFLVNADVPPGYDSARFVALARSAVERWGGTFAGTTVLLPTVGDAHNVIGFDLVAADDYELTRAMREEMFLLPLSQRCATRSGRPPVYKVKRAMKRVRAGGRTFRLRRDRAVKVPGPTVPVPVGTCTTTPPHPEVKAPVGPEIDVGIAHELLAYELGPDHPVQRTKVDMATLLAKALGEAAGVTPVDHCDTSSPVTSILPGEWWRSPTDFQRLSCHGAGGGSRSAVRPGYVRHVLVQR